MKGTIAISGLPCSGSTTTSQLLSEKLNLDFFSIGQIWKDVSRGKVKEKFYYGSFKQLCDKRNLEIPHFEDKNDSHGASNLWNTNFGKSKEFNNSLDELQINLAEKGSVVIDSKLAIHMLPKSEKKIWLKASLDERAKRSAQRDNIEFEEARNLLDSRIKKQETEWKKIYGFNYLDLENKADIIIDTTSLTPEEVVEKILQKI